MADPSWDGSDAWVIKIDKNGNLLWKKFFGSILGDAFFDIAPTSDGGFIAAGNTYSSTTNSDFFIVKMDADGNAIWQKNYGGPGLESARTVRACSGGGYMIGGTANSNSGDVFGNHGSWDAWIIKLDEDGNLLWQKCIGGSQQEDLWEMSAPGNDQYIFAAGTSSTDGDIANNHGTQDALTFCLDGDGNLKWLKNYGGTSADAFLGVSAEADGTVLLSGHSGSNDGDISGNHGGADFILFKLKPILERQVDTSSCEPFMLYNNWVSTNSSLTFQIKDACGHDSVLMHYNITMLPPTFVQSIPDITIGAGEQVILTTTAAGPVQWTGPGLSCTTCLSPVVHPSVDSRYVVTATSGLCKGSDTVNIHVVMKDSIYIPSAFTPNGDGLNDVFKAIGSAADFTMKIYNRWGQEIFQSNTITTGWNGELEGKRQPTGLYVYLVVYKNVAGKYIQQKGTVLLVR